LVDVLGLKLTNVGVAHLLATSIACVPSKIRLAWLLVLLLLCISELLVIHLLIVT